MSDRQRDPEDWGPWRTETRALIDALYLRLSAVEVATADQGTRLSALEESHAALTETVRLAAERLEAESQRITAVHDEMVAADTALRGDMEGADTALHERIDEHTIKIDALAAMQAKTGSDVAHHESILTDHEARIVQLEGETEPGSWQQQKDLIDLKFRPVLGCHTGGGSSFTRIQEALGRKIQVAPIYWKTANDPTKQMNRMLARGTLPRLELCFPHIVTSLGHKMSDGTGSFWGRVPDGGYDDILVPLLQSVGALDQPILLSLGHESDLTVEDGSSPKVEGREPTRDERCGDWDEYPAYHAHLAGLARQHAPRARIFLNFSGGYSGSPERWSEMLPPAGTFDFFGWDPYSQYGKTGDQWESFEQRAKLFGRWDWYKDTLPDVPVIIGETGVCAHANPTDKVNAGQWLLDMVDFMVENRWQGVGTGGGISMICYFSHHYSAHPRCLDDAGTHKGCDSGQKNGVLAQIGADQRLAWAD